MVENRGTGSRISCVGRHDGGDRGEDRRGDRRETIKTMITIKTMGIDENNRDDREIVCSKIVV